MLKASLRSHLTLWFTGLSLLTLLIVAQTICSAIAQAAFAVVGHVTVSVGITLARASDANPAALISSFTRPSAWAETGSRRLSKVRDPRSGCSK